ncbi:MAG: tRNA (adenosine(37)-N6)-dimethylallyltransferase MiaA [Crocinitomicaceae bacterium]|nr:tRNA (adenosine(37)-N6)-dimethylallyltransferase MiaA [Crocinitomicaceae bacterium]
MTNKTKHLVFIVGPTAIGKTGLGVHLANKYNSEVISCDSRQIYQEMAIGTAKPTVEEMEGVPHHFVDSHSIFDRYTAGMFETDALKLIDTLFEKHDVLFAVGGSGLYVNALAFGIEDIPFKQEVRDAVINQWENEGLDKLVAELKEIDPEYAATADLKNPRRVMRGLEVYKMSGKKYSEWRNTKKKRPFKMHWIGLNTERETLYERIHKRVDIMLENGLLEENKELFQHKGLKPLETVGYQEIFKHLEGNATLEESIEQLKRNTRVFAKKQITWFKKIQDVKWYAPRDRKQIEMDLVHNLSK